MPLPHRTAGVDTCEDGIQLFGRHAEPVACVGSLAEAIAGARTRNAGVADASERAANSTSLVLGLPGLGEVDEHRGGNHRSPQPVAIADGGLGDIARGDNLV